MHFLMFQMKRAHWSAVKSVRLLCEEVGLTPARFDIMFAALDRAMGTPQSAIREMLGLSRTTVSKMIRRMIELGLVARVRSPHDARTFLVTVTAMGYERMRRLCGYIEKYNPIQRRFETAFDAAMSVVTAAAVQNLRWALRRCATRCGDTSMDAFYPYRLPEDGLGDGDGGEDDDADH